VKRPSCKWKGQTDADEALPEARVARLAECRIKQKAGYNQHASLLAIRLLSLTEHLNTIYLGEVLVCAARMRDGKPEDWHELYEDEDGPQIKKEAEWFLKKFPNMLPRLTEDGEKVWLPP